MLKKLLFLTAISIFFGANSVKAQVFTKESSPEQKTVLTPLNNTFVMPGNVLNPTKAPCTATTCATPIPITLTTLGTQVCATACNDASQVAGPDFVANNCYDFPNPTIWFEVTTPAATALLNVTVTSATVTQPYYAIFGTADCSTFTIYDDANECYQGTGGTVTGSTSVPQSTTLLIAVSAPAGQTGTFNVCITPQPNNSACNVSNSLTVTSTSMGSPAGGPYQVGEVVNFCYTINTFEQDGCNWLQGIVPTFGDCWDPSSFTVQGEPVNVTSPLVAQGSFYAPDGAWNWWPAGSVTYNNLANPNYPVGTDVGAGWFFSEDGTNDPDVGWGDGNGMGLMGSCEGATSGLSWSVCFSLTVTANCATNPDCSVSIKTFGDGEIGGWNQAGCVADLPTVHTATVVCCLLTVNAGIDQTICNNSSATLNSSFTNNDGSPTFAWTASVPGGSFSSSTVEDPVYTPPAGYSGTITLTLAVTDNDCTIQDQLVLTVNPVPVATATPNPQTICSGTGVGVALTSTVVGTTYTWSTTANASVTGESTTSQSGATITDVLTNTTATPVTVNYTVTPTAAGCVGTPIIVPVTVNPTPVATATPNPQTICSGNATGVALTSNVAGTTFAWSTPANASVTGETTAGGTGASITDVLTNTTTSPVTLTYTVTPTANGCVGLPISVPVTVNPIPVVTATPNPQTICSGNATGVSLTSNVAGTSFAWSTPANGSVTGETTAGGSGASITDVLTNTTTSVVTLTYTVTPTAATCVGLPISVPVTVNPTPVATATPNPQTICSGNATGVALTSNVAGTTFAWSTTANASVTGETTAGGSGATITDVLTNSTTSAVTLNYTVTPTAASCVGVPIIVPVTVNPTPVVTATPNPQTICSGNATGVALTSNVAGTTFAWSTPANGSVTGETTAGGTGASITDVLTNTTTTAVTLTYTVTPTAATCVGLPISVPVTVNPTPVATATPNPQTICSGNTTGVALTSNVAGTTFAWSTPSNGSVTGETTAGGSGATITDVLTNITTSAVTLTYTVTPTAATCVGLPVLVPVTVNPIPVATATPNPQTICSGNATGVTLTSNVAGTTFAWSTPANGSVTGETTVGGSGATITDVLTNTTTSAVTLTYTVTPTAATCVGLPISVPVTVNPTPVATATPNPQTICSGDATGVALTSNVAGTTFAWSTPANGSVTGETTAGGLGASISDVLTNTTSSPVTVTYTVTPTAVTCVGLPINVPVTINPIPTFTTSFTNPSACGASDGTITLSGLNPSTGYSLSYSDDGTPVGPLAITSTAGGTYVITGLNAGGYSNITITFAGCSSLPASVSLSDPSSPVFTVSLLTNPTTCGGTQGSIHIEGTGTLLPSTVYALTYTDNGTGVGPVNITTDANGDYDITGLDAGSYTAFVLNLAGCTGSQPGPVTLVDPALPVATAGTTTPVICDGSAINLTGNTVGGATYSWTGPNLFTSNVEDPSIASATTAASGTYTLTITLNNCVSLPSTVNVTVNATPVLTITDPAPVCSPATVSITAPAVTSGSTNVGTLTYWTDAGATSTLATPSAITTTGTYYIQANNAGCTDIAPVAVTVVITPDVVVTNPAAVCSPLTVDLTAGAVTAGSSNLGALTYWTDAAATIPLGTPGAVATSGTYFIQSGISGCTDIEPVVVTINQTPNLVITDPAAVCSPSTVNITAPAVTAGSTNATSLTYWNDAAATSSLAAPSTVSVSNTYYIQATNAGCTDIAPVIVTINQTPNLVITNPAAVCTPATVDLTAAAVTAGSTNPGTLTYWTDGSATTALGTPNAVATGGTYYIQADNAGCTDVEAVVVTINQTPNLVITDPAAVCTPSTVDITVAAVTAGSTNATSLTYWTDAAATSSLASPNAISVSNTYYIQATNAGCTDIAPVVVTVDQTPNLVITNPAAVCSPATVDITAAAVTAGSTSATTLTYWTDAAATSALAAPNAISVSNTYYIQATNAGCTDIAPVVVTVNQTPNLVITDPAAVCTPGTVDLTAPAVTAGSSNVVALTYWTDLAATSSLSNAGAVSTSGTYYIQATNAGCTDVAPVVATINTTPTLVITDPAAVCTPATVDLTAAAVTAGSANTGTLTYWTDAATTSPLATPTAVSVTNTYYIQADNSGCIVTLPVDVTVNQTPNLVITDPAAVCSPATVDLTAAAVTAGSTNLGILSYWTDAAAISILTSPNNISVSNTYYIQALNAGCTAIAPVIATINTTPSFTLAGADPSLCNLSDGSITISGLTPSTNYTVGYSDDGAAVAAAPYTSTAAGTITITGLNAGAYNNFSVTITSSGCTGTNATTVTLINPGAPVITDLADQTVCDTYTLPAITITGVATTQGYYTAPNGGGIQLAVGSSVTATQTIYIYAINGTCTDEETVLITVNNTPAIDPIVDVTACATYTLPSITGTNLSGSEAFYNNSQAVGGTVITGPITTTQTVWVYDEEGSCSDETSFVVTINPLPTVTGVTGGDTYCADEVANNIEVAVTGSNDWTIDYTLDGVAQTATGSTSPVSLGNLPGVYVVTNVTDANCTNSATGTQTIIINAIPVAPTAGTDTTYCTSWEPVDMTVTGTGGTYIWYTNAGLTSVHGTGPSIAPSSTEGVVTYYVTETLNGCEGPASAVTITIQDCEIIVPTAFTPNADGVHDTWEIVDLDDVYPNNVVTVYNRWGNMIYQSEEGQYSSKPWDGTYEGEALPVASYYFVIDFNDDLNESQTGIVSIILEK